MTKKIILAMLLSTIMIMSLACSQANETTNTKSKEYYTFELNTNVKRESVSYKNRFGITIEADLYTPTDMDTNVKYQALVVGPPYGGVKEQGAGVYANELARRGFVVIAIDPSYNGESAGEPRHVSSPDIFVEDFSAAVDYLGTRPFVDRNKIGAIGICGSGGFALTAAQVDTRIKAVATASMYDMSRTMRYGFGNSMTDKDRTDLLNMLAEKRYEDFEKGEPEYLPAFPAEAVTSVPEGLDPISAEFFGYYATERGHHPNSRGNFTTTSMLSFINFPLLNYIDTISPRPILFIMGDKAHSRYFSEDAYKLAKEPKELYIVADSDHVALYDKLDKIPFDKLEEFFNTYLK